MFNPVNPNVLKNPTSSLKYSHHSFGGSSRYDSTSDTQIFYSQTQSPSKSTLTVYAFDRSFKLTNGNPTIFGNSGFGGGCTVYELPGFTMVNDIGVTDNYYISTSPKLKIDGLKYNLFKDPGSSIEGVEGGGEIFLMGKKVRKEGENNIIPERTS